MVHKGQIVEKIVRQSGYSLTKLAERLGIGRNTLYNRFANENLSYHFIMEVGKIIHYDFAICFPEIKQEGYVMEKEEKVIGLTSLESKYTNLLEKYSKLLELLIKVAHQNGFTSIHQALIQLMDEMAQDINNTSRLF
jgi:transcriptional regulator with XRE-family HTH domain